MAFSYVVLLLQICETDYDGISLLLSLLEELPAPTAAVSTIAKVETVS